jgi:hypothetical protein
MPARNKLAIRVYRNPSPNVAVTQDALMLWRNILFLGMAEAPNLVALQDGDRANRASPCLDSWRKLRQCQPRG